MDSLLELFCDVDDFCKAFLPVWNRQLLASGAKQRQRARSLTVSEIMTRGCKILCVSGTRIQ